MRKLVYWFVGDETGRKVIGGWNWCRHTPVLSLNRPKAAIARLNAAIAEESLHSMQENVQVLQKMVSQQTNTCVTIQRKYERKAQEIKTLQSDNRVVNAFYAEQFLSQLQQQVKRAEELLRAAREKLQHEQKMLEQHKADMQIMNDLAEVDQAISEMAKTNNQLQANTAGAQFTAAKAIFHKQLAQLQSEVDIISYPR